MMYAEFLKIANVTMDEVTVETYVEVIEPMYMASNLNKYDFIKTLNIKNITNMFESPKGIINKILEVVKELKNVDSDASANNLNDKFIELAKRYCEIKDFKYDGAISDYFSNDYIIAKGFYAVYGNETIKFEIEGNKLTLNFV